MLICLRDGAEDLSLEYLGGTGFQQVPAHCGVECRVGEHCAGTPLRLEVYISFLAKASQFTEEDWDIHGTTRDFEAGSE